ncbi:interferon-induced protein 44-like [Argopecten irradians]|uniref:interferon-induced protein 44-like n=1 Tax=Argopecten irradians TaxID=31199 RepID=UPI00371D7545
MTLKEEMIKLSSVLEFHKNNNEQMQRKAETFEAERTQLSSDLEHHRKKNEQLQGEVESERTKTRVKLRNHKEVNDDLKHRIFENEEEIKQLQDDEKHELKKPKKKHNVEIPKLLDKRWRLEPLFDRGVRKYPIYASDNRRQLMFQLCDCRGLEDGVDITQDIESILEGHIHNNYVINPASPLKENMHGYNQHPGLEDKIHCVVYILEAEKHSDHADIHTPFTTEDVRNQIENIQTRVEQKGIPQLILLNKVDIVCESTMLTTSDVYRSSLIRQRCIDAAEFLGLSPMTVLPMRNYYMETSTTDDIGILALFNIRQMLRVSDTFLPVNYLQELRSDKYEPQ